MHRSDKKELWQVILAAILGAMLGRAVTLSIAPQWWVVGLFIGFATGWIGYDFRGFGQKFVKAWHYTINTQFGLIADLVNVWKYIIKIKTGQFWAFAFTRLLPGMIVAHTIIYVQWYIEAFNPESHLIIGPIEYRIIWFYNLLFSAPIIVIEILGGTVVSLGASATVNKWVCESSKGTTAKEFFEDFISFLWQDGFCQLAKDIWWLVMNCYKLPLIIWNGIKTIFLTIGKLLLHIYRFTASHGRFVSAIGATTGITVGSILNQPLISILLSGLVGGICAGILYLACKLTLPLVEKKYS